jgi:hypothetical protein
MNQGDECALRPPVSQKSLLAGPARTSVRTKRISGPVAKYLLGFQLCSEGLESSNGFQSITARPKLRRFKKLGCHESFARY